jgi:hypothetical protein
MLALKRPEPRLGVLEIEPYAPGSNTTRRGATWLAQMTVYYDAQD